MERGAPPRLLVVEDESIVARDIMGRLSRLGYDVVGTAATGEDALQLAREWHPQVILMDIMLKGEMDGIRAAELIQQSENVAVIYLTAYSDEATLKRAKATAPYAYVLKPFYEHELHTAVEMALYRHTMEAELRYRLTLEETVAAISADLINLRANEIDAGLNRALQRLGEFADADRSYVFQINHADYTADNIHEWCRGGVEPELPNLQAVPLRDLQWWMGRLERSQSIVLHSLADLPSTASAERALLAARGIQSLLVVPMVVRGELIGFLGLDATRAPRQWPGDLAPVLKTASDIVGGTIARARSDEALTRAHEGLECRVEQRTAELAEAYADLKAEVDQREMADAARHEAETQLAHSQRIESVGTLAGGMAHDFNNLLAIILGHTELLLTSHQLPESATAHLRVMLDQGNRCADLVRKVLDFSRRSPTAQCPLDMSKIVAETAELLQRTIPESVQISCRTEPHLHVVADPTQVQQVLTNLAVNARDAMPGGGRLSVATSAFHLLPDQTPPVAGMTAGEWVLVTVSDTGVGMTPETLNRICEPYFTTKEIGKGTGLGLSQVHGIVQLHRGFLQVTSAPGQGTTIGVYLPAIASVPAAMSAGSISREAPRGAGQSILYVEDEGAVRDVVASLLRALNYNPISAANGEEALRLHEAHQHEIAVVISDVVMPGMGGLELCRAIRGRGAETPIILMSGYPWRPTPTNSGDWTWIAGS